MSSAFGNMLNKSRAYRAKTAIRNAPEKPFPELEMEEQDKLFKMLEELFELNGKKYSELTLNQKRLVEFFCMRTVVNAEGKKPEVGEKQFRVLRMAGYAHRFSVRALSEWFGHPALSKLHIIEDEPLNYLELYGETTYPYSGSPYHDGLRSYPDKYLPIRDSKSRAEIWAVWCGKKPSDVTQYKYKQREYTLANEVNFRDYPLYEEAKVEVTKDAPKVETKTIYHSDIEYFLEMQGKGEVDEKVAELYKERLQDIDAFKIKYNNPPNPSYSYAKKIEAYLKTL